MEVLPIMRVAAVALAGILAFVGPHQVASASFVSLAFGLDARTEYPCPFRVETARWAASDHAPYVVVQWGATRAGDRREIGITAPNGRRLVDSVTWTADSSRRCSPVFVPTLGTTAETWLGPWQVTVSLNGRQVGGGSFELIPAREGALAEYQRLLAASPNSAVAHFRVGASAAIVGQLELAESRLAEASRLSPTWWVPPMALARVYLRQGKLSEARERLAFLRGLLLGRRDEPETRVAFYKAMLEDLLKEAGE